MNTVFPTDTSTGFADAVLYQDTPATLTDYLSRISSYRSTLSSGPQPDTVPTTNNLHGAKVLLLDKYLDTFPFDDQTSRAHALAMTLQPLVRPLISGPTPIYVISGPATSGKTTLVKAAISPYGEKNVFSLSGYPKGRNWQQVIAAGLAQSPTHFWIEDYESRLSSPALAQALSVTEFTVRKLYKAETITLPVRCLWVHTAINPSMSKDITLRSVSINLAWNPNWRTGHLMALHQGLDSDMIQPRLFSAALTLVRAWLEAGQPAASGNAHRYTDWSRVMGGILEVAGIPGFLDDSSYSEKHIAPANTIK